MKIKLKDRSGNIEVVERDPTKLYSYSIDENGKEVYRELPGAEVAARQQDEVRHADSVRNPIIKPSLDDKVNYLIDKFYILESDIVNFIRNR